VRAQPPATRPTWVTILGAMMLLASGSSLVSGLLKLSDPGVVLPVKTPDRGAAQEAAALPMLDAELRVKLAAAQSATLQGHRTAVRIDALIEVALALFGLYATAAVMAGDRHGRRLGLHKAGLVIVYLLGGLPFYLSLMRDYADHASLLLAAALQGAGRGTDLPAAELAQAVRTAMIGQPIMVSVVGVAWALVLIGFFGGRRGRRLYGLESTPGPARRPARPDVS
jgi:hypothetical protein